MKAETVRNLVIDLLGRDYYATVDWYCLEEAVENSIADNDGKLFATLDELDNYIRENYI